MSILIKGIKMPKSCLLCPFGDEFGKCCVNLELEDANELTHSCPLVELPDHGDLIDADWLKEECKEPEVWWETETQMKRILANAPVVIPAERSIDKDKDVLCKSAEKSEEECEDENWYTELDDPKFAERSE